MVGYNFFRFCLYLCVPIVFICLFASVAVESARGLCLKLGPFGIDLTRQMIDFCPQFQQIVLLLLVVDIAFLLIVLLDLCAFLPIFSLHYALLLRNFVFHLQNVAFSLLNQPISLLGLVLRDEKCLINHLN